MNRRTKLIITICFVIAIIDTYWLSENAGYKHGLSDGKLIGANVMREQIELDLQHGATYEYSCDLVPSPFYDNGTYEACLGYWVYPAH